MRIDSECQEYRKHRIQSEASFGSILSVEKKQKKAIETQRRIDFVHKNQKTIDGIVEQLSPGMIIEIPNTDQEDSTIRHITIREFLPDNRILVQEDGQENDQKHVKRVGIISFLLNTGIIEINSGLIETQTKTLNKYLPQQTLISK